MKNFLKDKSNGISKLSQVKFAIFVELVLDNIALSSQAYSLAH
jgi:hypothetical protein